jgi:antitoxin CptB
MTASANLDRIGYFRWRCRRGMKELDFVLNGFLDQCWDDLSHQDKQLLDDILEQQDMLLWYWFSGQEQPQDPAIKSLVKRICAAGYHQKP